DRLKGHAEAAGNSERWMAWYFDDHRNRAISPFSHVTVSQWIQNRLDETGVAHRPENGSINLDLIWEFDPDNPRCLVRMARNRNRGEFETPAKRVLFCAEKYSRRAVLLAPKDAEVLWRRAAILALLDHRDEAMELARHCPDPASDDLWGWEA